MGVEILIGTRRHARRLPTNHLSEELIMILLQFKAGQEWHLGVKTKQGALDVTAELNDASTRQLNAGVPSSLAAVCSGGLAVCERIEQFVQQLLASDSANRWLPDEATLTYGPCVANPGK